MTDRYYNPYNTYQAKLKNRFILKQNIAKSKNKDKTDITKFPYLDKLNDPFNMPDLPKSLELPKAPTYNYVKPEKHEKKQKSFSLFWGLINIKF